MIGFIVLLAMASVVQSGLAQAPAGAPAGANGLCNDGTYSTAANKSGACRGHKGIKTWFAAPDASKAKGSTAKTASTPAPAAAPAAAPAPAPAQASTPAPAAKASTKTSTKNMAQAPGGGAGLVWLNTESNVYHCQGTQFYGKTKAGSYMTEDAAKAKGAHADHGKPCK
jgi:hypothetical protein